MESWDGILLFRRLLTSGMSLTVNITNWDCQLAGQLFLMNAGLIFNSCGLYFALVWCLKNFMPVLIVSQIPFHFCEITFYQHKNTGSDCSCCPYYVLELTLSTYCMHIEVRRFLLRWRNVLDIGKSKEKRSLMSFSFHSLWFYELKGNKSWGNPDKILGPDYTSTWYLTSVNNCLFVLVAAGK